MATDPYAGFEVVEQTAPDPYAGFEVIEDAQDRKLAAEERRERDLARRSGGDTGETGYIQDTANRTGRASVRSLGSIRKGLSETAKMIMEPIFRAVGGEEMVQEQRANARNIQGAARPAGTANISQDERFQRAASSIRTDPTRDDTATAAVAEFAGAAAPIVVAGPLAPLAAGAQMGGGSLEASEAAGLSPEETRRRFLINTAGGTALGFLPIPGINRAGSYADAATAGLRSEAQRQLIRRGVRAAAGGASGAGVNIAGDAALQLAENETLDLSTLDLERLRQNAIAGFGAGTGLGLAAGGGRRPVGPQLDLPPPIPEGGLVVDMPAQATPELLPTMSIDEARQRVAAEPTEAQIRAEEEAAVAQQQDQRLIEANQRLQLQELYGRQSPQGAQALRERLAYEEDAAAREAARIAERDQLMAPVLDAQARDNLQLERAVADADAESAATLPTRIQLAPQAARAIEEFDELAPQGSRSRQQRRMRLQDRRGFVDTELLTNPVSRTAGATAAGAVAGSTQGDTIEERLRNAALGAGGAGALALAGPSVVRAAGRGAKRRPEAAPAREFRYSVFEPDYRDASGQRVVQVDDITGRADGTATQDGNGSRSLQDRIAAEEIPPIPPEILDTIPTGTYTQDEIMALVAAQPVRRGPAPAVYAFTDELPPGAAERGITGESFKLTEDIPGHPAGSNVSRSTLEAAGYDVPPVAPEQVRRAGDAPPPNPPDDIGGGLPPGEPPPDQNINFDLPPRPGLKERVKEGAKGAAKLVGRGADHILTPVMTRLNKIAPEVGRGAAGRYEYNVRNASNAYKGEIQPFLKSANDILKNPDDKRRLTVLLSNGNFDGAVQLLADRGRANPAAVDAALVDFARAQAAKNDLFQTAKDSGIETGELDNYWPRKVDPKQLDKFFDKIGRDKRGPIWDAVKAKAEQLGVDPESMSLEDRAEITNQVIRGVNLGADGGVPGQFKARGIADISDLENFYLPFDQSAIGYVDSTVRAVERRKLMGRTPAGADGSLGQAIERARDEAGLTAQDEADIRDIFQSRFDGGEKGSNRIIKMARDITNTAYLGQMLDAVTQVGDFFLSPARYGFRDFAGALFNPNEISAKSIGLEQIAQEFTNKGTASKAIEKLFNATGFRKVVEAAQNNTLNTSLRSMRGKSKTAQGIRELQAKYERAMGPEEFRNLLDDLQNDRVTDNVKYAAFTEITDSQPITLMEMPQAYLDNPNGKWMYALKTYPLKQIDLFRREAVGEVLAGRKSIADGNKKLGTEQIRRGARNLVTLAAAYTLGGASTDFVKDLITGRDIDPEDYANTGILRLIGLNRFDMYNFQKNGLGTTIRDKIVPSVTILDEITKAATEGDSRIIQRFPFIGDLWFEHFTEGGKKRQESQRKRREAEERKENRTPAEVRREERAKERAERRKKARGE